MISIWNEMYQLLEPFKNEHVFEVKQAMRNNHFANFRLYFSDSNIA